MRRLLVRFWSWLVEATLPIDAGHGKRCRCDGCQQERWDARIW